MLLEDQLTTTSHSGDDTRIILVLVTFVVVVGAFYEKWSGGHHLEFWFDERTLVFVPAELPAPPLNGVYDQALHYALWPAHGMPSDDQPGLNEAYPASYFFWWQVTLFYELVG